MSACFAEAFTMLVKSTPHSAHSSLEPRDKTSSCVVLIHLSNMCKHTKRYSRRWIVLSRSHKTCLRVLPKHLQCSPKALRTLLTPRSNHETRLCLVWFSSIFQICVNTQKDTPGDGFEPPLEEPESSVLPLDDPGISFNINNLYYSLIWFALPKKCKRPKSSV